MGKVALLIIDVQKEFENNEKCRQSIQDATSYINAAASSFRENDLPIVFVQDVSPGVENEGFELVDGLDVRDGDYFLTKEQQNAFYDTDLEKILKDLDVDYVILSGFAIEYCVRSTMSGAAERGFGVSLLQHGLASVFPGQVQDAHHIRSIISYDVLDYMLEKITK